MLRELFNRPKSRSLIYIIICTIGGLGFLAITVIPTQLALKDVHRDIRSTEARIAKQEILYPFYQQMLAKIERLENNTWTLPYPETQGLARSEIDRINTDFIQAARQSGIRLETVSDLGSLTRDSRILEVNTSARGDFFSFREFLVKLGAIPYLKSIGRIEIRALPGEISYRVKCRIALQEG